ncbi:MAG: aldehyde dehydrogenase family protein, partial [bacterium]
LIHGKADIARHAVMHPDVDGVLFTGSYRAGAAIHQSLAGQPHKMIALEMGGNNPLVVCSQGREQMGATIYTIVQSAFITSGQRCSCARRLILPDDSFGDLVLEKLVEAMRLVTVGHPQLDPQPFLGSIIHLKAARELKEAEARWLAKGAKSLVEMRVDEKHRTILYPGLVSTDGVELEDEEWFGPLLRVERSQGFDHAIELANRTSYGLTASLLGGTSEQFES